MPRIHLLSDHLISQIAAGEVVERPASVVKELLENAVDAGAGEISVDLEAGGKRRIRVADDGSGMGRDDALLAFDRHATSKIASFEDLERVGTLGFRGEALATIAAVSRVELVTAETPGDGHLVRIEGGRVRSTQPAARGRGTTLDVASLFFNVPARRKFLKTTRTELQRSLEVVQGYALARPEIAFSVRHDSRLVLEAAASAEDTGGARERIRQVFGAELADRLVALPETPAGSAFRPWGFVGQPQTARRRRMFVFVNRRLVRDRAVLATFYRAVRETWKGEDPPALFLFLDLPPEEVDVNVHPQKAEVRFRGPRPLDRLFFALREALEEARGEVPAVMTPVSDFGGDLRWRGLGEQPASGDGVPLLSELREPAAGSPRLAEVSYRPVERLPVPLSGRSGEQRSFRLLGQYKGTMILLEGPDGLYIVDQHVAHERILYERFRRHLTREQPPSQALLEPVLLELAPAEAMALAECAGRLDGLGFSLREMSGGSLALVSVPAALSVDEAEALLLRIAAQSDPLPDSADDLGRRLLDDLAASLACRAAVKMHHPLGPDQMEALIAELFVAEQPYACPHGRPIVLRMEDRELERRFGRR